MSVWVTVPTRGDHPDLLERLVAVSGVPRDRVVVVRTADCDVPDGVAVVDDRGAVNIHRWWNAGIRVAEAGGARTVVVLNDDVTLRPASLLTLVGAMEVSGAAFGITSRSQLTGHAWAVRLDSGIRPDERFRWWFGDNDLAYQAGSDWVGIDCGIRHVAPNRATVADPRLRALAEADRSAFEDKWGVTLEETA